MFIMKIECDIYINNDMDDNIRQQTKPKPKQIKS